MLLRQTTVSLLVAGSGLTGSVAHSAELEAELEADLLAELQAELGHGTQAAQRPSLEIYGFADVILGGLVGVSDRVRALSGNADRITNVMVGNLNVYLDADLTHGFRSLMEVRFHMAPTGSPAEGDLLDGTRQVYSANTTTDPADVNRPFAFGYIEIERAYLEAQLVSWLSVRIGRFLTPYGVWNVDHGSPVVIPVRRPYLVSEGYIPEHSTGVELLGSYPLGSARVGYHLYGTNGRGPVSAVLDVDDHLAFGGRIFFDTTELGRLTVGLSFYHGTDASEGISVSLEGSGGALDARNYYQVRATELTVAGDATLDLGPLHLQTEVLCRQIAYDDNARRPTRGGTEADRIEAAGYLLVAYELPFWRLQPYALVQGTHSAVESNVGGGLGIRVRVIPSVAFKLEYQRAWLGLHRDAEERIEIGGVHGQASWAF